MEIGRRLGSQVGDAIRSSHPDIRGDNTAAGFSVSRIQPPTAWRGPVLAHVDGKRAGAFTQDPFFLPVQSGKRVFLEFFLAGPLNAAEDVERYLRALPGDKVEIDFTRRTLDQRKFRLYHTLGLTNTPDVLLAELDLTDRATGTLTAAVFHYVSDVLAKGGHRFQVRPMDAAGNERTGCTALTAVLAPWPLPPTGVEVHAYSAHIGRVTLKWTKPADDVAGDRYFLYRSLASGQGVAYGTVVGSATSPVAVTGSPSKSYATCALGVTGAAAAGLWLLAVRHKSGSVTEDNFSALARFVIADTGRSSGSGYPFRPSYVAVVQKPGGRLVVAIKHDNAGEPNRALRFKVYRGRGDGNFFDHGFFSTFFSPPGANVEYSTAVGVIQRTNGSRFFEGTAGFAGLTEGLLYNFGVRSEATGGVREVNTGYATGSPDATPPTSCPDAMSIAKVIG